MLSVVEDVVVVVLLAADDSVCGLLVQASEMTAAIGNTEAQMRRIG
jgi:hypothetical protein